MHKKYIHSAGGGALHLAVSGLGLVDGTITVRGQDARSTCSGGGSGGTLIAQSYWSHGWGHMIGDGGNTYGTCHQIYCSESGGGGAGGRIKLLSPTGISKPLFWTRTIKGGTAPSYHGEVGTLCPLPSIDYFNYFVSESSTLSSQHSCGCVDTSLNKSMSYFEGQRVCSASGEWNSTTVCNYLCTYSLNYTIIQLV